MRSTVRLRLRRLRDGRTRVSGTVNPRLPGRVLLLRTDAIKASAKTRASQGSLPLRGATPAPRSATRPSSSRPASVPSGPHHDQEPFDDSFPPHRSSRGSGGCRGARRSRRRRRPSLGLGGDRARELHGHAEPADDPRRRHLRRPEALRVHEPRQHVRPARDERQDDGRSDQLPAGAGTAAQRARVRRVRLGRHERRAATRDVRRARANGQRDDPQLAGCRPVLRLRPVPEDGRRRRRRRGRLAARRS